MDYEIADLGTGIHFVHGRDVNWLLVREGADVTLVDAGYLGYRDAVEASIREIGRTPHDVRAILLTHAHIDHLGAVNHFHERYGTPVYVDPREVGHARREYLEQASPLDVARRMLQPGVAAWMSRIVRAGALRPITVRHALPFATHGPLDVPGRPVPVPTHGHTSGHSAYWFPAAGVVATGDALATGHALSPDLGPQLLPAFFDHGDGLAALSSLEAIDADQLAPGHGPAQQIPIAEAVAQARARPRR